ncbi:FAD-dependent oxidoreductase [Novosphingobium sp. B 225]|uniref:FAD-dependent oxidoreductase n=1 Tax=Novosphingobium sp. B 225 TaxID=1961849 RepID=UPI000B4AC328|nr:NAD(P)/FAD-dependent oxidoreductase [Novosphingobium sp. B 225]
MGQHTIAIAGCGPAGLASALLLARQGHRVSLFDRFPEPRPLGSGLMLQPSGMAVLAALGLAEAAMTRGALIERLLGLCVNGRTVLDARYSELSGPRSMGLGIHRAGLFDLLHAAVAEHGIELHAGHEVVGSHSVPGGRMLRFAGQADAGPFDLVVDALGLHTPLAPPCGRALPFGALWVTLPWPEHGPFDRQRLEQRYRAAREMVGVLPTGQRPGHGEELALFWSLRCEDYPAWLDRGLDSWRDEVAALWPECAPLAEQVTDPAQLTMARYAHRTLPVPAQDRLIHIGDSWHTASPQLGQGANMALLDAWGLAEALRLGGDPALAPALTVQLRGWHVALYQWATAFFTPLYQSNAAFPAHVRDRVFAPLSRLWPGKQVQALLMSGLLGAPLRRLGLERVDYLLSRAGTLGRR